MFLLIYSCVNVHNQQHILVMCAAAFYLIENYPLDVGPEFSAGIIQVFCDASSQGGHVTWDHHIASFNA